MHLAQGPADYIINLLRDDPVALIQVLLISRAWVGRVRAHICETMTIARGKLVALNPSFFAPLRTRQDPPFHMAMKYHRSIRIRSLDCFEMSELHTLVISSCELHSLDEQTIRRCFAKFPCPSIITLWSHDISSTHRTSLALLLLFPNVDNLVTSLNRWGKDRPGRNLPGNKIAP